MKSHPTYEILQEIGRGEAAIVYRARDLSLKRYVAIKELQDKYQRDPRQMEQFWEDAQFVANLGHDNIVQVFGVDKERGWIILELMRGGLDAKLAEGPLAPDLVRSVLRQALEALQFLHKRDRLHGAVKPSNLLINDEGRVKLSDSVGVSLGGEMRKPTGTPKYLAPESLNGQFGQVGPGVDLYALGFTALELLKGPKFDALFKGVSADAADPGLGWLRWHSSAAERLPSIREVVPGVPADLAAVIERMIKKQVSERYGSASEALHDLDERPIQLVDPVISTSLAGVSVDMPAGRPPEERVGVVQVGDSPRAAMAGSAQEHQGSSSAVAKSNRPLKPWSKPWINQKLEDPKLLAAVLAAIIIPTLLLLFMPSGASDKKKKKLKEKEVVAKTDEVEATPTKDVKTTKRQDRPKGVDVGRDRAAAEKKRKDEDAARIAREDEEKKKKDEEERLAARTKEEEREKAENARKEEDARKLAQEKEEKEAAERLLAQQQREKEREKERRDAERRKSEEDSKIAMARPSNTPPPTLPATKTNSIAMTLVLVKPGTFTMGSPDGVGDANERPRHDVNLSRPYYIGESEVTQSQYKRVMGENPSYFSAGKGGEAAVRGDGDDLPVESVSYDDAVAFCKKLDQIEGLAPGSYRLPTEAEWEYAARGGARGSTEAQADIAESGWFEGNAGRKTNPVKQKRPNAIGLYDTAGNVWEWCGDWFDPEYYRRSPRENPVGPDSPRESRVLRGGGWIAKAKLCRPTDRNASDPSERINCYGFRVVLDPAIASNK